MQTTSTSFTNLPDNFPNGNLPVVHQPGTDTSATPFASRIMIELRGTARGVQNIAAIVFEAKTALSSDSYRKLSQLTGLSPSTLSKYLSIHSQQQRFASHLDRLPPSWTVQYELSAIRDETFEKLVACGKLRPDLTTKGLYAFVSEINRSVSDPAPETTDQPQNPAAMPEAAPVPSFRTVAVIKISSDSSQDVANSIKEQIASSFSDPRVHVDFPVSKTDTQRERTTTALEKLQLELAEVLTESDSYRSSLSPADYQVVENAAFQHHQKIHKGTYPYPSNELRSIEHPDHSYSITGVLKSAKLFFKHLHSSKLITPYSPAADFGSSDEARSIKLGIDYCEAKSPKAKSNAKKELQRIAADDPANGRTAERVLKMIFGEAI